MKKTVLLLIATLAFPALAQPDPPAPTPDPLPNAVNPFVHPVSVTLTAGENAVIRWDTTGTDTLPSTGGILYEGKPIVLAKTTLLRTVAVYPGNGQDPKYANYGYVLDLPPTATLLTPTPSQSFRVGDTVRFSAQVTDTGGPAPLSVRYYRYSGSVWTELTTTPLTAPPFAFNWQVGPSTTTGAMQLRAIAADDSGLTDTASVSILIAPDNQPPTASLAVSGSLFVAPASFTLTATANDPDGSVTKVEFYRDTTLIGTDAVGPPWTLNLSGIGAGAYNYKARSYDNGTPALSTLSAGVSVTVTQNQPPTVAIDFPEPGASYVAPFAANIAATASDLDGGVAQVAFYANNALDNTDLAAPWGYSRTFQAGSYKLVARATDALGASALSDTVAFTVTQNQRPVARTAKDTGVVVLPDSTHALDGSGSSDPEGSPLAFKWTGPAGVSFNADNVDKPTVKLPKTTGNYVIQLKVTDAAGLSDSIKMTLSVWSRPAITSGLTATAAVNEAFAYTVTGTGFPVPALNAASLPAWLVFNPSNNTLSGRPTARGAVNVGLTATNPAGSDAKTLVITVGDSLTIPVITSPSSAIAQLGSPFSYTITATGNPSNFTFGASGLPPGLTLAGPTISGTPTTTGNFTVNLTATNTKGSGQKVLNLSVNQSPSITVNLPDSLVVKEGDSAAFTIQARGFPAVSYQWQFSQTSPTGGFTTVGTNSPRYVLKTSLASAGWYRVLVRNGSGPDVYSRTCRLRVTPLPLPVRIVSQPTQQTVAVGNRVEFKAKATGDLGPLRYQWFRGAGTRTALTAPTVNDTVFTIDSATIAMADVYQVRVTNNLGDTINAANHAWSDTARLTVDLPKLPKPIASPGKGTYYSTVFVTLRQTVPGAVTWYSLDGTPPYPASPNRQYAGEEIPIDSSLTLNARSYYFGVYQASDPIQEFYNLIPPTQAANPEFHPADSAFAGILTVTITAPDGSDVYYTTDGSDPYVGGELCPLEGFAITQTTTVKALSANAGLTPSPIVAKTYVLQKPKPKVALPQLSPDSGTYPGSVTVRITCGTPNAQLRYTTGNSLPDSSSPLVPGGGVLTLNQTTRLNVIGMLADYLSSDVVSREYRIGPGQITARPSADTIFRDSIHVTLTPSPAQAIIRYTLGGGTPDSNSEVWPEKGMTFRTTTTVTAVPYLGSQRGNTQTFNYTYFSGPVAVPSLVLAQNDFTFKDTILIGLKSTRGAKIYYTLDGSIPLAVPENLYSKPFTLDRSATVLAIGVMDGFESSGLLTATFTLVPQKPEMKPPGGSYNLPIYVSLSSPSRSAELYYTVDGTKPTPQTGTLYRRGAVIPIENPATLQAIAASGNLSSEVASAIYTQTRAIDTNLAPGRSLALDGGYTLRNPESEAVPVRVNVAPPLPAQLKGFDAVQYVFSLSAVDPNPVHEVPKLAFTAPASEFRSLYKLEPGGGIYFISSGDTITLSAGTYFLGVDTLPPAIRYLGESFQAGDSTQVEIEMVDNVAGLTYSIERNDGGRDAFGQAGFSNQKISIRLKHPAGVLKPLYVRVTVSDYTGFAFLPDDPFAKLSLSQKISPLTGPEAWTIGTRAGQLYDLVGIPLDLDPPLTLSGLRQLNPGVVIEGSTFSSEKDKYVPLADSGSFTPGRGHWIASRTPIRSLRMPAAVTKPGNGSATYTVKLRKGWNEISNPHLETLYWPYARALFEYPSFPVKAPHRWENLPNSMGWKDSDSLLPWRGYMVYSYLPETTVTLLSQPPSQGIAKTRAKEAAAKRLEIVFGWKEGGVMRLGAGPGFGDAVGIEDEPALPGFGNRFLNARREGRKLASDWIGLEDGRIRKWSVEFGSADDTLPELKVYRAALPPGYEAWALSPSRGLKFPLTEGGQVPASGLSRDSLIVIAGTREMLADFDPARSLSEMAPALDARVLAAPEGFRLRLALPSRARIAASIWSLDGSRLGRLTAGPLAEGTYDFAFDRDFKDRSGRLGPGMYVVTVEIRGRDLSTRLSRKLLISR